MPASRSFASVLLAWQSRYGRLHLPWKGGDPYRVWLSEIMLQQTQVATVIPYFERFISRWPTVHDLAAAQNQEVMHAWSGLGYYRRAVMLHKAAQQICLIHGGEFPRNAQGLMQLAGVGRTTAAAIAAFCFGERISILDANVRRVLTRVFAMKDEGAGQKHLWGLAQGLVPMHSSDMPAYTQGLMDFGATVCKPRRPLCTQCPMQARCQAHAGGSVENFPVRSQPAVRKPLDWWALWLEDNLSNICLVRRPEGGIWGGLFTFPLFDTADARDAALNSLQVQACVALPDITHTLTHRDVRLRILHVRVRRQEKNLQHLSWWPANEVSQLGLPAPLRKLLSADFP